MKKSFPRTIGQIVVIVGSSTVLALAVNAGRTRGLDLTRDYFEGSKSTTPPSQVPAKDPESLVTENGTPSQPPETKNATRAQNSAPNPSAADPYPVGEFGFREIKTRQVYELHNDPRAESMAILFVDARNDEFFQAGHIPRAVQLDHYYVDQYMPDVAPLAQQAEWVVVYCGGGDCEDSRMACDDLMLEGMPQEKILLYKGGWSEWKDAGYPQETSSD